MFPSPIPALSWFPVPDVQVSTLRGSTCDWGSVLGESLGSPRRPSTQPSSSLPSIPALPNPAFSPILLPLSLTPFTVLSEPSVLRSIRQVTLIRSPSGNWREQESFNMAGNDETFFFFFFKKKSNNRIWPFWKDLRLDCWWWEALISVREIL